MFRYIFGIMFVAVIAIAHTAQAREVAGINLAESVVLPDTDSKLVLNGAGVRSKFVFKIYVAGLYLAEKTTRVKEVLEMPGAKRVHMHFVYKEVSQEKLVKGWDRGFENNLDDATLAKLAPRLSAFNRYFATVKKGDIINLDFKPGKGTEVWLNGTLKGSVEGDDFYRALLLVWLGEEPADESLKQGMLGVESE